MRSFFCAIFRWVLDEIRDNLAEELDFEQEAANSEQCLRDLRERLEPSVVHVPDVKWVLTSKRILTTEFIHGIKISHAKELADAGFDLAQVGERLVQIFAEQIFQTGFVHADPHPGNLLVRRGDDRGGSPQIVLLDHGLYQRIPAETRQPLARVWQAVVENDHSAMKRFCRLLRVQSEDYRLFCMILTQRFVYPDPDDEPDFLSSLLEERRKQGLAFTRTDFKALPEEDKAKLRAVFRDIHDKMFVVFRDMPPQLMLIFRNLNIIRSILKDHGSGVDRYRIMARVAVRGFFCSDGKASLLARIRGNLHQVLFDLRLSIDWLKMRLAALSSRLLYLVGYASPIEVLKNSIV